MFQQTDLKFLMTVYQKVIFDFISLLEEFPEDILTHPIPTRSQVEDDKSVDNILSELIAKCYQCAGKVADIKGDVRPMPEFKPRHSINGYVTDLQAAFVFTKKLCTETQDETWKKDMAILTMNSSWGNLCRQAIEHAIVQILRHQVMLEIMNPEEVTEKASFYLSRPAS